VPGGRGSPQRELSGPERQILAAGVQLWVRAASVASTWGRCKHVNTATSCCPRGGWRRQPERCARRRPDVRGPEGCMEPLPVRRSEALDHVGPYPLAVLVRERLRDPQPGCVGQASERVGTDLCQRCLALVSSDATRPRAGMSGAAGTSRREPRGCPAAFASTLASSFEEELGRATRPVRRGVSLRPRPQSTPPVPSFLTPCAGRIGGRTRRTLRRGAAWEERRAEATRWVPL
jgi:hypothetical protein